LGSEIKKLFHFPRETKTQLFLYSPSTMGELLKREGLVVARRKRRKTAPYTEPLAQVLVKKVVFSNGHAAASKRAWNMVLSWGRAVEIEVERLGLRQRFCSNPETTRPSFSFRLSSDWK
jgi:hypothetical protein